MSKYCSVPLLFLFVGSLLGVFLRWQFISPTPGVNYTFFLHAHSHVMFLGWIFNALYIGFTINHILESEQRFYKTLFIVLQILVVGMLISFPIEGYDFYSIFFSTLHTLGAIIFFIKFYSKSKFETSTSIWYARVALLFFLISTLGPFSLGYLMANGMGQSQWYYFSIYFYLHFQYNGFFLFGVFSLLFNMLEKRKVKFSVTKSLSFGKILAFTCAPAYLLSILWAKPGYVFNILAGLTALAQLYALVIMISFLSIHLGDFKRALNKSSIYFLSIVLVVFIAKLFLQLISAFPLVAQMAYDLRPVVIAYLHMVLLGIICLSLFVWYLESDLINIKSGNRTIILFFISFIGMEVCLILTPWSNVLPGKDKLLAGCIFFFSAILSFSCFLLFLSSLTKKLTKIRI